MFGSVAAAENYCARADLERTRVEPPKRSVYDDRISLFRKQAAA